MLGRPVDLRVPPSKVQEVHRVLEQAGLQTSVISSDIQQLIESAPMVKGTKGK